ncbi:hypothetical protein SLS60_001726 [Paraconiothyrium brasiliense]|uniref:Chitin-binding type-1 domain-containing protein n=1 Tax=Paraconiothyrium brasiliense TaxID=300254 RepID=A0ABR3S056_9PLEO
MSDFDISCDGVLMFNGSRDFWACPVDDYGVRNIYTEPVPNQLKCIYITVTAGIVGDKLVPYAGCRESPPEPDWIWPWDKFYNNSLPVQPSTSEGVTQTTNHLKDSQHVASNATTEKLTGQLGVQSSDGRCGAPTGFHCFGKTDGPCCSPHGWCGFSALHCGAGCQGDFSICDGSSSSKASNGTSTSSMVTSTTSPTGNALHGTSSKPPSKTSSTGKASSSTSSKALSKTSSAGTVPISSASPSSKASSGSLTSSKVASTASSKAPTKASSAGKAPSSTFSKALSKTSSAGKVPSSSTSSSRKTISSNASASLKTSATSAPKEDALSPNGQCGGDVKPSETAISPIHIPHPLPSRPEYDNGTYPSPVDCNDPANAQKCGNKFRAYGCPHDLEGTFESPRLMVAVDKAHPDKALDNRFDGTIGDEYCTLYNFEVHPRNAGKKCSLVWLFPETEEEEVEEVPVFDAHGGPNSSVLMEFWHVREPASHGLTW